MRGQLDLAEAVVLPHRGDAGGHLRRFRLVPRLSSHVRHREKYLDVPVPAGRAFGGRYELPDTLSVHLPPG